MKSRRTSAHAKALCSADTPARTKAAKALARMGPAAVDATDALIERLGDSDATVARWAAVALGAIGSGAVAALGGALSAADPRVRSGAALALSEMGPDAAPAVPVLGERLADPDENVRFRAAVALGAIGRGACAAIPQLEKALQAPTLGVRQAAVNALGDIGTSAVVAPLARVLRDDPSEFARREAAQALGKTGRNSETAVAALAEALFDPSPRVRTWAAIGLKLSGPAAAPAKEALLRAAESDPGLGSQVEAAIQMMSRPPK